MLHFRPQGSGSSAANRKTVMMLLLVSLLILVVTGSSTMAQYQLRSKAQQAQPATITVTAPVGGDTWEKGKRYDISWQSSGIKGMVKIDLLDSEGKAVSVIRQTRNSGKYTFAVKPTLKEGDYKIRVSSLDGKTVGVTAATIHIGKAAIKTNVAGTYQPQTTNVQPMGEPEEAATGPTQATGIAGTVAGGESAATSSAEVSNTAGNVTSDPAQLHDQDVTTGSVVQVGNLNPLQVPESDLARLEIQGALGTGAMALPGGLSQDVQGQTRPNDPEIVVTDPGEGDYWVAGVPQTIRWRSENIEGPVKLDLVHVVSAQQYDFFPVTASANSSGTMQWTVPVNLNCDPHSFYLQVATLDDGIKGFSPPIDVYHESVDMTCKVMGLGTGSDLDYYVVYAEKDEWLKFDVWFRNNGIQSQINIPTIRVILIKEPEEVVMAQEEFGFSQVTPHLWYKTPEPRKFNIRKRNSLGGTQVNLRRGAYRVEVEVDPLNYLGEDAALRADNKAIRRFTIH